MRVFNPLAVQRSKIVREVRTERNYLRRWQTHVSLRAASCVDYLQLLSFAKAYGPSTITPINTDPMAEIKTAPAATSFAFPATG
jgi:hypothetical protein